MVNRILTRGDIRRIVGEMGLCDPSDVVLINSVTDSYAHKLWYAGKSVSLRTPDLLLSDRGFINKFLVPLVRSAVYESFKAGHKQYANALPRGVLNMNNQTDTTAELLNQRGEVYGDYADMSRCIQNIKAILHHGANWNSMSSGQREALEMIAVKIGRILTGDPNHRDSWRDIAGYATLAADRIAVAKTAQKD